MMTFWILYVAATVIWLSEPHAALAEISRQVTNEVTKTSAGTCVCQQTCQFPDINDVSSSMSHPRDCAELKDSGHTSSGTCTVYVGSRNKPLEVYCDQDTDGGGWLVFQRREDGSEDFYRNWNDYQFGFGDIYSEFWLGNHNMHLLTSHRTYELRVDMSDFEGDTGYAVYESVSVGTPVDKYRLDLGKFSEGDAGDSLGFHNGAQFSTHDNDNDADPGDCASHHEGAGWFVNCYHANPNGRYMAGDTDNKRGGIVWETSHGYSYSMKTMEMKIRPKTM